MADALKKFFSFGAFYWIPACIVVYLWIFVAGTVGGALAKWNLDIFSAGVLVVVPALLMPLFRGLVVVLISGLLFDVSLPIPFEKMEASLGGGMGHVALFGEMTHGVPSTMGFGMMWMAIFFFILRFSRAHIELSSPRQWLICALLVNFFIFLFWAFALSWGTLGNFDFWIGFFVNAFVSSIFIVLAGWWFFDAFVSLYRICGIDLVGNREGVE